MVVIRFFLLRALFPRILPFLIIAARSCLGGSTVWTVSTTPYDGQMERIVPFLEPSTNGREAGLSIALVNQWLRELRRIPYGYSQEWRTPCEVAGDPVADCKGKAVCLYERMRVHGERDIQLVIGKRRPSSRLTHTWVAWKTPAATYVLDPTLSGVAYDTRQLPGDQYVPYFLYSGSQKFRAVAGDESIASL